MCFSRHHKSMMFNTETNTHQQLVLCTLVLPHLDLWYLALDMYLQYGGPIEGLDRTTSGQVRTHGGTNRGTGAIVDVTTRRTTTTTTAATTTLTLLEVLDVLGGEGDADAVHPRLLLAEALALNVRRHASLRVVRKGYKN